MGDKSCQAFRANHSKTSVPGAEPWPSLLPDHLRLQQRAAHVRPRLGPGWQKLAAFRGAQNNPSELS